MVDRRLTDCSLSHSILCPSVDMNKALFNRFPHLCWTVLKPKAPHLQTHIPYVLRMSAFVIRSLVSSVYITLPGLWRYYFTLKV